MEGVPEAELDAALLRNDERLERARARLYSESIGLDEAAVQLSVTPSHLRDLITDGDLLGLDGPDGLRLPLWQFGPAGELLPGLRIVLEEFPGGVLGVSSWVHSPNPMLDGNTPCEALARGRVDQVVVAAAAFGE